MNEYTKCITKLVVKLVLLIIILGWVWMYRRYIELGIEYIALVICNLLEPIYLILVKHRMWPLW